MEPTRACVPADESERATAPPRVGSASSARQPSDASQPPSLSAVAQDQLAAFRAGLASRRPLVTYACLLLLSAVFALETWLGGAQSHLVLLRMGGAVGSLIRQGEWWRLLSATLLHGGVLHLGMNLLAIYSLGSLVERLLGPARLVTILVVAGLAGSGLGVVLTPPHRDVLSIGASGAVFGLLGTSLLWAVYPRRDFPVWVVKQLRKMALVNGVLNLGVSLLPQVDHWAHLGGALAGAGLALAGFSRPLLAPTPSRLTGSTLAALLAVVALGVSFGKAQHAGRSFQLRQPITYQRCVLDDAYQIAAPTELLPPRVEHPGSRQFSAVFESRDGSSRLTLSVNTLNLDAFQVPAEQIFSDEIRALQAFLATQYPDLTWQFAAPNAVSTAVATGVAQHRRLSVRAELRADQMILLLVIERADLPTVRRMDLAHMLASFSHLSPPAGRGSDAQAPPAR